MIQYQLFNADAGVRYFLNLRWGIDGMVTGLMGEDFSPITWQPYRNSVIKGTHYQENNPREEQNTSCNDGFSG